MKLHQIGYYKDGLVSVAYCKICSAEGEKLLEDCPQNTEAPKKYVDPQKIIDDFENYS